MPNKAEFARLIKEKYPDYKDVPDDELVKLIIAKYPEYKDQIDDAGLWEKSGRPLWEGPARLGKKIAETQYAEAETPGKYTAPRSRGFFKGVMPPTGSPKQEAYEQGAFYEGLGTGFSGLTSPRNLAMGILSKGAQLARGMAGLRGVPSTAANPSQLRTPAARISQAANIGVGAIAAPQVVEGVSQAIYAPEIEEKGLGGLNAVMGLMGVRAGLRGVADIARSRQLMDVLPPAPTFPLPRGQATPETPYSPIYNGSAGTAPSGVPYRVNTGARTVPSPEGGRIPTEAAIRPVLPTKLEIKRNLDEIVTQIRNFKIEFDHAKEVGDDDTIKELAIKGRALQGQYAELKAEYEKAPEIIPPNPYGQATPETVGEVVNLPPQLAAQYGTSLGTPEQLPVPHISGVPYDDTYKLWQLLRGLPADPSNATKIGQMIGQYNLSPEDINRIQTGAPETPQPYGEQVNYEEPALNDPSGWIMNGREQPVLNRTDPEIPPGLINVKSRSYTNNDLRPHANRGTDADLYIPGKYTHETLKRIDDLKVQQNLAYRNNDIKKVVEIGQEIEQIENQLYRAGRDDRKPGIGPIKAKQQRDPDDLPPSDKLRKYDFNTPKKVQRYEEMINSIQDLQEAERVFDDLQRQETFARQSGDPNFIENVGFLRDVALDKWRQLAGPNVTDITLKGKQDSPFGKIRKLDEIRKNFKPNNQYSDTPIVNGYEQRFDRIVNNSDNMTKDEYHNEMQKLIHDLNESMKKNPAIARQLQDLQNEVIDKWNETPVRIGQNDLAINTNANRWSNSDSPVVRDLANRANELVDVPLLNKDDELHWAPERRRWIEDIYDEIKLAEMQNDEYRLRELEQLRSAVTGSWDRGVKGDIQLDEPSFMRVPGTDNVALGGADERVLDILATSLYSKDRPATIVKELLQNSIDELKISENIDSPIKVVFAHDAPHPVTGDKGRAIVVKDFGRGLTKDQIYTVFSDVGKTGKGDEALASGGFGIAKAAPFLAGDFMKIESTVNENGRLLTYTFEGTPAQLKKQTVGVPIKTKIAPLGTKTGLKVEVFFPSNKSLYTAKNMLQAVVEGSPAVRNVQFYENYHHDWEAKTNKFLNDEHTSDWDTRERNITTFSGKPIPEQKGVLSTPGADVRIHYELDNKERQGTKLVTLNKGLFVSVKNFGMSTHPAPNIPEKVVLDIDAKVEEGQEGYPFTLSRESLNEELEEKIRKWLEDNIAKQAEEARIAELQKMYDELSPQFGNEFVVLDSGNRYTPEEFRKLNTSPHIRALGRQMQGLLTNLTQAMEGEVMGQTAKFGFLIGEDGNGGINIPDPRASRAGEKNYAVLVNPFSAIKLTDSPKAAAQRLVHVIIHEFNHNIVRSEGASFTWSFAKVHEKFDLEKQLEVRNAIEQILSLDGQNYNSEIEKLLHEYTESRRRPETTPDLLSRERASEWIRSEEPSRISEGNKSAGKGTIRVDSRRSGTPVGRLAQALHAAKRLAPEQRELYAEERYKRIRKAARTGGTGRKWATGYLRAQQGQLPKVEFEALKLNEADVDALFTMIKKSKNLSPFEKNGAITGLIKVLGEGGGYLPQENEINKIARALGDSSNSADIDALVSALTAKKSLGAKTGDVLVNNVVGATKTAMASFDMSAALRQALPSIHRKEWWSTFPTLWRAWGGHKGKNGQAIYDGIMLSIRENPYYDLATEAGIAFTDMNARGITGREEHMVGSWLERIPSPTHMVTGRGNELSLYSRGIKGSNRSYTAFLNKLRMDVFASIMTDYEKSGLADKKTRMLFARQTAEYVNNTTGRGSLGKLEPAAKLMNVIFFSPRNMASRVNLLKKVFEPSFYRTLDPRIRWEYLKSMFAWIAAGSVLVELSKLIGAEVSNDPTSPDFRKAKINKTRFDPYGGFQQYVVLVSTLMSGNRTSSTTGRSYQLGKGYGVNTRKDITENFFVNKLSPEVRFAYMMWDAHTNSRGQMLDQMGQPMNPYAEQAKLYIPLVAQDIYQVAQEDPLVASILAIPMFFGASVQEYAK